MRKTPSWDENGQREKTWYSLDLAGHNSLMGKPSKLCQLQERKLEAASGKTQQASQSHGKSE